MGILQGLLAFLKKSAGKLLQAIFGWAVRALFGSVRESEKTLLSGVVGAAAAWPLLLMGIPFPKIATFVLGFIPIPEWVSPGLIRVFWIVAALLVPLALGAVLARRGRPRQKESRGSMLLQAFPITAAIAAAFMTAFVTAPIRRLIAMSRRREELTIPLLVEPEENAASAKSIREALERRGFALRRGDPPWLLTAPSKVMRALGGRILRGQIPENVPFYCNADLDVVVAPNAVTLQGEKSAAAKAHGLICELATLGPGLQTVGAESQNLERALKDIGRVYRRDPEAHRGSEVLASSIDALAERLATTPLDFDDWQILYREILQLSRAIDGRPQLLRTERANSMEDTGTTPEIVGVVRGADPKGPRQASLTGLSTPRLVTGLTRELRELLGKEVALAKAELRVDLKAEMRSIRWLGIAIVLGLGCLNLLFVAAALWLARALAPPVAALVVAGVLAVLAVVSGLAGKASLVKPLETTRRTLHEGWTWAKNRVA